MTQRRSIPIVYHVGCVPTGVQTDIQTVSACRATSTALPRSTFPLPGVRLTLRAVCEDKDNNGDTGPNRAITTWTPWPRCRALLYRESTDETDLFVDTAPSSVCKACTSSPIHRASVMEGDHAAVRKGSVKPRTRLTAGRQLDLESTGDTGRPEGERVQFGCSSRIRHTPRRTTLL